MPGLDLSHQISVGRASFCFPSLKGFLTINAVAIMWGLAMTLEGKGCIEARWSRVDPDSIGSYVGPSDRLTDLH